MAAKIDQNALIGAGAGALLGALAMTFMKKKATPSRLALGAAVGAAAIGGVAYASSQSKVQAAGMDQTGMLLPIVGEVDLVKAGSGAFAGAAIGTAFGSPVIGTAVGAAAGTALSKWASA